MKVRKISLQRKANKCDIVLRSLTREDAVELYRTIIESKRFLSTHLPWVKQDLNLADSEVFIESITLSNSAETSLVLGIDINHKIVGIVGFNEIDKVNRVGKIGYWISENLQNNGYISKSVKKIIQIGFEEINLNRIEIRCGTQNIPSQRVAIKYNFFKEGIIRDAEWLYDKFVDHFLFSILKSEYNNSRQGDESELLEKTI